MYWYRFLIMPPKSEREIVELPTHFCFLGNTMVKLALALKLSGEGGGGGGSGSLTSIINDGGASRFIPALNKNAQIIKLKFLNHAVI